MGGSLGLADTPACPIGWYPGSVKTLPQKKNGVKHRGRPLMSSYHLRMHAHAGVYAHIHTCK